MNIFVIYQWNYFLLVPQGRDVHNRRCSAAQPTVHNRVITKPCKGEIIKLPLLFGVHNVAIAGCRDAMHCVSTILLRCATPPVMHISSLRD
jgi:hypothetical protein